LVEAKGFKFPVDLFRIGVDGKQFHDLFLTHSPEWDEVDSEMGSAAVFVGKLPGKIDAVRAYATLYLRVLSSPRPHISLSPGPFF
jgi:hypothetical protein